MRAFGRRITRTLAIDRLYRISSRYKHSNSGWERSTGGLGSVGFGAGAALCFSTALFAIAKAVDNKDKEKDDNKDSKPTYYTLEDVAKHNAPETGIWVTFEGKVYDITHFVESHPGGDRILLAAGKDLAPFWRIYQQHNRTPLARQLLKAMEIGLVHPDSLKNAPVQETEDPFAHDPEKHPMLKYHSSKPANAELPMNVMLDSWITPSELWFIRNHSPVPVMVDGEYRLIIQGPGVDPLELTVEDIVRRMTKHKIVSTIQCAGNRRAEFENIRKTSGIPWGSGAVSTAEWGGVYLRDILANCGLLSPESAAEAGINHIIFTSFDGVEVSIPIEKAMNPYGDVLLAYEMNGELLEPEHGFPFRVIVPGVVGVRNLKWLKSITTSKKEAEGPWQKGIAYKALCPNYTTPDTEALSHIPAMQEQPVQSVIVTPHDGSPVDAGEAVTVRGYAWSGGGRGILRVDVSADGGKSWMPATLKEGSEQNPSRAWAWTFWEADVSVPESMKGENLQILCKAVDSAYNVQPESAEPIWNIRGLNNNSWHRTWHPVRGDD